MEPFTPVPLRNTHVAIAGARGSGKNTLARGLAETHVPWAFADHIRHIIAKRYNIPWSLLQGGTEREAHEYIIGYDAVLLQGQRYFEGDSLAQSAAGPAPGPFGANKKTYTYRELMTIWGKHLRTVHGPDFFAKKLQGAMLQAEAQGKRLVVTDMRRIAELDRARSLGFLTVAMRSSQETFSGREEEVQRVLEGCDLTLNYDDTIRYHRAGFVPHEITLTRRLTMDYEAARTARRHESSC